MKLRTLFLLGFCFLFFALTAQQYEIYVSDAGNFNLPPWQILKFDENGENPEKFIIDELDWPQDILFMKSENKVLISNLNSGRITTYNAESGEYIEDFASMINGPTRMKIGPDSLLYVLQWNGPGFVQRYELDGTYLGEWTDVGVPRSIGLDWDADGNLYVSSYNNKLVRRFNTEGQDMGLFINSNLLGPTNIWFDASGDLLVSDYSGTSVKRFDSSGNYLGEFITGLGQSEGVAFYPNGDVIIGCGRTNSVKRYDEQGNYINDLIAGGSGDLINPNALVLREIKSSGFNQIESEKKKFIIPNIGSQFHVLAEYAATMESMSVFASDGRLVARITGPVWNASNVPEGVYYVNLYYDHSSVIKDRLIVQY